MPTYFLNYVGSADVTATITANSLEEAEETAHDHDMSGLCAHCSGAGRLLKVSLGDEFTLVSATEDDTELDIPDDSVYGELKRARERIAALEKQLAAAEKTRDARPSRFMSTPEQVLAHLRELFAEDVVDRFTQHLMETNLPDEVAAARAEADGYRERLAAARNAALEEAAEVCERWVPHTPESDAAAIRDLKN